MNEYHDEMTIKGELKEYFVHYPGEYIEKVVEVLMKEGCISRCYSYSGWWVLYRERARKLIQAYIQLDTFKKCNITIDSVQKYVKNTKHLNRNIKTKA